MSETGKELRDLNEAKAKQKREEQFRAEELERAARAAYNAAPGEAGVYWMELTEQAREEWRRIANAVLTNCGYR